MEDVLVLQAARFGDLLQTGRLLKSLARDHQTHLAADSSLQALSRLLYPDTIFHPVDFHVHPGSGRFAHNRETFTRLKSIAFKKIYNCNFSPLTATIARLFDQAKVSGYRPAPASDGGELFSPWIRLGFRISKLRAASPLNLVDFWAWFATSPLAPDKVNPLARPGGRGLGIAIAGRDKRRSLKPEVLAAIARTAARILGNPEIRLFGTDREKPDARRMLRLFPSQMQARTIDLCGKTDWYGLITEMTGLDLLITPDTGLMHLAAFLGVPVAAFFLSSAWCHETGPYGEGHLIFQATCKYGPCIESSPCTQDLICHKAFEEPAFQRLFFKMLSGASCPETPENLQVWKSGFDAFGAKPTLLAGSDPHATARSDTRQILADKTGLLPSFDPVGELFKPLLEKLEPASEWMLPPLRYC